MFEAEMFTLELPPASTARIGIFDSGVGGLSILRALRQRLPDTSMLYVGDVAWSPYGDRSAAEVRQRSQRVTQWLVAEGATMVVVACNTATVISIEALRAQWPGIVFVGVEPGVKPAAARSRTRRIAVMATAATAASERLRHLIARYAEGAHVHVQACPGLADAIERGALAGPPLLDVLRPHGQAILRANVDTVVLGCTHYGFVADSIQALLGSSVTLIDTAEAVAGRCVSLWEREPALFGAATGVRVVSTGNVETLQSLLRQCPRLEGVHVDVLAL